MPLLGGRSAGVSPDLLDMSSVKSLFYQVKLCQITVSTSNHHSTSSHVTDQVRQQQILGGSSDLGMYAFLHM